ncbi:MAG: ABC transporter substrate-binding protein [Nitrospirae bacterium]|nr:ABC transporter substrate-binding protein [Nitrospirota bacterium]
MNIRTISLNIVLFILTFSIFADHCLSAQKDIKDKKTLNMAVEYTNHAAAFYYAEGKGLFRKADISINEIKVYTSGVGVAVAFTKGSFDAGYMCLVPAIFTYANGGVPIKILAGTHKDGYGLVVNSEKIKTIKDLEKTNIKIANGPKGTTTDFLQMLMMKKNKLNTEAILSRTLRMSASKQLMALQSRRVDAVFVPEHFATLAASFPGMKMLLKSTEIWPDMQGSVLVVTKDMIRNHPDLVKKLKRVNSQSIKLINKNRFEAANIFARSINSSSSMIENKSKDSPITTILSAELAAESTGNMRMTPDITRKDVQDVIDKMYELGYLRKSFDAAEIMADE